MHKDTVHVFVAYKMRTWTHTWTHDKNSSPKQSKYKTYPFSVKLGEVKALDMTWTQALYRKFESSILSICSNLLLKMFFHPGVSGTSFWKGHSYPRAWYSFSLSSSLIPWVRNGIEVRIRVGRRFFIDCLSTMNEWGCLVQEMLWRYKNLKMPFFRRFYVFIKKYK